MDSEWLFDYVMEVFLAPTWNIPIMSFIDEHCVCFDDEEENKLEYTLKHNEFCQLVESLVEDHLQEIGVDSETFLSTCTEKNMARVRENPIRRTVIETLLAIDDFVTFKGMMFRRNRELEVEAIEYIKKEEKKIEEMSEDDQLALALERSKKEIQRPGAGSREAEEETIISEALKESEIAHGLEKKKIEAELANLEAAISASLALEKLKEAEALEAKEEEPITEEPAEQPVTKQPIVAVVVEEETKPVEEPVLVDLPVVEEKKAEETPVQKEEEKTPAAPIVVVEAPEQEAEKPAMLSPKLPKKLPSVTLSPLKASIPVPMAIGGSFELPSLENLQKKKEEMKKSLMVAQQKAAEEKHARKEVSEVERKRRAEYLQRQRDMLRVRREQARAQEMNEFKEHKKTQPIAAVSPIKISKANPAVDSIPEEDKEKRRMMIQSLLSH
eukprot:TRINITY_DN8663_c0_g2_i1.p1 TRINITY_DN8663_c0_g2~~TRINITY_DN8663_c0_g2_i1.p1  ORF type:complete len:442 (-),score=196.23 TRINITY_DN8663_c0_g2_i1:203-1528(-)